MTKEQNFKLASLYQVYRNIIKPLIAEIEASYEKFPQPIFNEIRSFNDHISRCYAENATASDIDKQLEKASSHITRMVLDCYKFLNIYYCSQIELFEKQTKRADLTKIDNGNFYIKYKKISQQCDKSSSER